MPSALENLRLNKYLKWNEMNLFQIVEERITYLYYWSLLLIFNLTLIAKQFYLIGACCEKGIFLQHDKISHYITLYSLQLETHPQSMAKPL